jgi:hypothetical protein
LIVRKERRAALHHKGLEPTYVPRQRGQINLGSYTNTKSKPKVQLPTKVAPKEENQPMLETKKVTLFYQGKSCLCRGWNVRRWLWATMANYDCTTDGMLECGFVLPRKITIVPWTECKKVVLCYRGKLRLCRGQNVRRWLCITKANRVCPADGMQDYGLAIPR